MTRRRDRGPRRDDAPTGTPSSVPDVARLLRRARTRQGLRIEDVSVRTGLNLHQLEALETGTVERIPDRVVVLQTLRRYADFLGLPGDRFVLAVVDHWPLPSATPTVAAVPPRMVPVGGTPEVTLPATATSVAVQVPPAPAPDDQAVRRVTRLGGPVLATPKPTALQSQTEFRLPVDTGVTPAVRPPAPPKRPRGRRAATLLSAAIGVLVFAVLVGVAGLVIHHVEPHWLDDLGITHSPSATPSHPSPGGQRAAPTTSAPSSLTITTTSPNSANISVHAPHCEVTVAATGGAAWVQATESGQAAPVFSGVLASGQSQQFPVESSLLLEVGSAAAHITVTTGLRLLGSYKPPAAPYTMTIATSG